MNGNKQKNPAKLMTGLNVHVHVHIHVHTMALTGAQLSLVI